MGKGAFVDGVGAVGREAGVVVGAIGRAGAGCGTVCAGSASRKSAGMRFAGAKGEEAGGIEKELAGVSGLR